MPPIEPARVRLATGVRRASLSRPARHQPLGRYLKGPISLDWISAAAHLPGKSLNVGLALWYLGGLHRSKRVPLSNIIGQRFALDRNSKYRGLAWLEGAGLVTVERKLGRAPVVTILDAPRNGSSEA